MTTPERRSALTVVADMMICKSRAFRGKQAEYRSICKALCRSTRVAGLTLPFSTYAHLVIPRKNGDPQAVFTELWKHPDASSQTPADIAGISPVLAHTWQDRAALVTCESSFLSMYDYLNVRPHALYPLHTELLRHTRGDAKAEALIRTLLVIWSWFYKSSRSSMQSMGPRDTRHFEYASWGMRRLFSTIDAEVHTVNDRDISHVLFERFVVTDPSSTQFTPSARDTICLLYDGPLLAYHLLARRDTTVLTLDEVYAKFRDAALVLVLEDRGQLHSASLEDIETRVAPLARFEHQDWPEMLRVDMGDGLDVMTHAISVMVKYGHVEEDVVEYDWGILIL